MSAAETGSTAFEIILVWKKSWKDWSPKIYLVIWANGIDIYPMEVKEVTSFSEALLASLKQQRSTLLGNCQKPLCDVILRCGGIATQAHSSVLASVSKYFEKILTDRQSASQVGHILFKFWLFKLIIWPWFIKISEVMSVLNFKRAKKFDSWHVWFLKMFVKDCCFMTSVIDCVLKSSLVLSLDFFDDILRERTYDVFSSILIQRMSRLKK